jgi:hypothetical protein
MIPYTPVTKGFPFDRGFIKKGKDITNSETGSPQGGRYRQRKGMLIFILP